MKIFHPFGWPQPVVTTTCCWLLICWSLTVVQGANVPDPEDNAIPGSSDYVPEVQKKPNIDDSISTTTSKTTTTTTTTGSINATMSNANVYEAIPDSNKTGHDPLMVNAQSPNPFLSGRGINPQIAMLLRNNPRLQMLARQNPVIAQQIMRNPQLLRDPMIQRAIQSQLSPGQGPNLLGQIGQLGINGLNGLGRALNPLGLPLNPLNRAGGLGTGVGGLGNGNQRPYQPQQPQQQNLGLGDARNFGRPFGRNHQQPGQFRNHAGNPHQDTLNGGYYGDNENYNNNNHQQPAVEHQGHGEADDGAQDGGGGDSGQQDYDGSNGAGGEEGAGGEGEAEQNPAEDPDIQQLQNFGGPLNDNFPEGLFPPGLLTKEDIEEIRRQQEKQQREAEERERQQQQQQNQQETSHPDYEDVTGANDGGEDTTTEYPTGAEDETTTTGNGDGSVDPNSLDHENHQEEQPGQQDYDTTTTPGSIPPAYQNSYQAIQPNHHQGPVIPAPVQTPMAPRSHQYHHPRNHFNLQPNVEYGGFTTMAPKPVMNNYHHQDPRINGYQNGFRNVQPNFHHPDHHHSSRPLRANPFGRTGSSYIPSGRHQQSYQDDEPRIELDDGHGYGRGRTPRLF